MVTNSRPKPGCSTGSSYQSKVFNCGPVVAFVIGSNGFVNCHSQENSKSYQIILALLFSKANVGVDCGDSIKAIKISVTHCAIWVVHCCYSNDDNHDGKENDIKDRQRGTSNDTQTKKSFSATWGSFYRWIWITDVFVASIDSSYLIADLIILIILSWTI